MTSKQPIYEKTIESIRTDIRLMRLNRGKRLDHIAKQLGRTVMNSSIDPRAMWDNGYTDGEINGRML